MTVANQPRSRHTTMQAEAGRDHFGIRPNQAKVTDSSNPTEKKGIRPNQPTPPPPPPPPGPGQSNGGS